MKIPQVVERNIEMGLGSLENPGEAEGLYRMWSAFDIRKLKTPSQISTANNLYVSTYSLPLPFCLNSSTSSISPAIIFFFNVFQNILNIFH
jgi:hypothetical protein